MALSAPAINAKTILTRWRVAGGWHKADLTPRQFEAMVRYGEYGTQKAAARAMGISVQTHKNLVSEAYRKLDVTTAIEAFLILGWLKLPEEVRWPDA